MSPDQRKAIEAAFQEVEDLLAFDALLSTDFIMSREALAGAGARVPYARRQFVRTALAKVEGFVAFLKTLTLRSAAPGDLERAEQYLLEEERPFLDDRGRLATTKDFPRVGPNLRFAMWCYGKVHGVQWELPVGEAGWSHLTEATKIRNRLMHPKSKEDLEVSEAETDVVSKAVEWVDAKHVELQNLIIDKMLFERGATADELRAFRELRAKMPTGE